MSYISTELILLPAAPNIPTPMDDTHRYSGRTRCCFHYYHSPNYSGKLTVFRGGGGRMGLEILVVNSGISSDDDLDRLLKKISADSGGGGCCSCVNLKGRNAERWCESGCLAAVS
ncbi:hypothetical protein LXL04_023858 [Taraxacum kok-saghyz]